MPCVGSPRQLSPRVRVFIDCVSQLYVEKFAEAGVALEHLRAVAEFFSHSGADAARHEGDLRRRSTTQRRLFARLGLSEALFFATASSVALDALRLGTKWAFRAKQPLRLALAH